MVFLKKLFYFIYYSQNMILCHWPQKYIPGMSCLWTYRALSSDHMLRNVSKKRKKKKKKEEERNACFTPSTFSSAYRKVDLLTVLFPFFDLIPPISYPSVFMESTCTSVDFFPPPSFCPIVEKFLTHKTNVIFYDGRSLGKHRKKPPFKNSKEWKKKRLNIL